MLWMLLSRNFAEQHPTIFQDKPAVAGVVSGAGSGASGDGPVNAGDDETAHNGQNP